MTKSKKIAIGILAAVVALMTIGAFAEDGPAIELEQSKIYNSYYRFYQDVLDIKNTGEKPVVLKLKGVTPSECKIHSILGANNSFSIDPGQSMIYNINGCDRLLEATVAVDGQDYVYKF